MTSTDWTGRDYVSESLNWNAEPRPLTTSPDAPDADQVRFRPYTLAEARADALRAGEGLSSGFSALDAEDFRYRPGKLYAVVGRPSEGKTAFLLETVIRSLDVPGGDALGPAVFVSYEENLHHIYTRLLLRQLERYRLDSPGANIPVIARTAVEEWLRTGAIGNGTASPWIEALAIVAGAIDRHSAAGRLVLVDGDADGGEVDRLIAWLRESAAHAKVTPRLVAVDYYQKVRPPTYMRGESRQQQLQEVADILRRYAKGETAETSGQDADVSRAVPVLVGAQVSREATDAKGIPVQPELAHIREADDLANDAAGVLTLHRPEETGGEVLNVKVVKNRDGRRGGLVSFGFHGGSGLITDTVRRSSSEGLSSGGRYRVVE